MRIDFKKEIKRLNEEKKFNQMLAYSQYDRLQREYEKKIEELFKLAMAEEKREIKKILGTRKG